MLNIIYFMTSTLFETKQLRTEENSLNFKLSSIKGIYMILIWKKEKYVIRKERSLVYFLLKQFYEMFDIWRFKLNLSVC